MKSENDDFEAFLNRCRDAVRQQVGGNSRPFHELWAHNDDVVLMGAAGAHQIGWNDVDDHLTWTAEHLHYTHWDVTNLMTRLDKSLAITIDLEQMSAPQLQPPLQRTLRVTQIYQHTADGWRLIARHGDPMATPVNLDPAPEEQTEGEASRSTSTQPPHPAEQDAAKPAPVPMSRNPFCASVPNAFPTDAALSMRHPSIVS